jgi:hypothetical protein
MNLSKAPPFKQGGIKKAHRSSGRQTGQNRQVSARIGLWCGSEEVKTLSGKLAENQKGI